MSDRIFVFANLNPRHNELWEAIEAGNFTLPEVRRGQRLGHIKGDKNIIDAEEWIIRQSEKKIALAELQQERREERNLKIAHYSALATFYTAAIAIAALLFPAIARMEWAKDTWLHFFADSCN